MRKGPYVVAIHDGKDKEAKDRIRQFVEAATLPRISKPDISFEVFADNCFIIYSDIATMEIIKEMKKIHDGKLLCFFVEARDLKIEG